MSSGQIFSDVNLQDPKRNTFLPYCPLDTVGGMSFTLVAAVHNQIIDFADVDLICGPGSTMSVCWSKHFMTLEAGAAASIGLLEDRDDSQTCEDHSLEQ